MIGGGTFALIVGRSGAGKDTLIGEAQRVLASDPRFSFARRVVTREAVAEIEDHDTVTPDEFEKHRLRGDYALAWEAHGLRYGLPVSVDAAILAGRVVVANISRGVIPHAFAKYRHCAVIEVTARPDILAERLAGRGRESQGDIDARLARAEPRLPAGLMPVVIDNSGPLETGVRRFLAALRQLAK